MGRITIELKSKSKRETLTKILDALEIPYVEDRNPSPSGDKFFLEPGNIVAIERSVADVKAGKAVPLTEELKKELFGNDL